MQTKKWKAPGLLILVVMLVLSLGGIALAAESSEVEIDLTRTGSLTITLMDSDTKEPMKDGGFTIYRVANISQEQGGCVYVLTDEFKGSGVELGDLQAEGLASHLAAYAAEHKAAGLMQMVNQSGQATWTNLTLGLYLVVQTTPSTGYYPAAPFLVGVPMYDDQGDSWIYDVDGTPKVEMQPEPPVEPELTKLAVEKVWRDDDADDRPTRVRVRLLRNGEVYDTVTLSEANGWYYIWEDLDASYNWDVVEVNVPDGYKVSYRKSGYKVTITNRKPSTPPDNPPVSPGQPGKPTPPDNPPVEPTPPVTPDVPATPPTPTEPPLIQTGQLNWPVPLMATVGILLFAVGWVLTRKRECE